MSRAAWSGWAHQLWAGLCEAGAFLALQNGIAMPVDAASGSQARSGV